MYITKNKSIYKIYKIYIYKCNDYRKRCVSINQFVAKLFIVKHS